MEKYKHYFNFQRIVIHGKPFYSVDGAMKRDKIGCALAFGLSLHPGNRVLFLKQ